MTRSTKAEGRTMATRMITTRTTLAEIRDMLLADGYDYELADRASDIKRAARTGCLLWTRERLTTTDASRIDARPDRANDEDGA